MILIREARNTDVSSIFNLIKELAVFEKAENSLINTPEQLLKDGFSNNPAYKCWVAEKNDLVIGIALCYIKYSTWNGQCLYLEDLIVTQSERGQGIGKILMDEIILFAKQSQYKQVQWQVLDWNQAAIDFYKKYDAQFSNEWVNVSVKV